MTPVPVSTMRRDLADRQVLVAYLSEQFPEAAAVSPHVSTTRGGWKAAQLRLAQIRPGREYAETRNHLDGLVTRLSPYLRHGVLGLAQVRDAALGQVDHPNEASKFISELAWRDYYQRVYRQIGDGIWEDREPIKTGLARADYASVLPSDIRHGNTGLACIDAFSQDLAQTGYLHNHARMWVAAYVVHWRRVRWQAGARWFLEHLLDGDPASNSLSWQWVASTFSHKPYIFNRHNLERYTGGVYCQRCPLRGHCDFEGSYETLASRLFPSGQQGVTQPQPRPEPDPRARDLAPLGQTDRRSDTIVWMHGDCLSPQNPALLANPDAPTIWVWDEALLAHWSISLKRIVFISECLLELPVEIRRGDVAEQLTAFARQQGATQIATADSPSPRFVAVCETLQRSGLTVSIFPSKPLVAYQGKLDLKRFSRYWGVAQQYALGFAQSK